MSESAPSLHTPRRRDRPEPDWIRAGDDAAFVLVLLVLAGGFISYGYAYQDVFRASTWFLCAILGAWGLVGWAAGRFDGPRQAPHRWILGFMAVLLAWTGFQTIPLPAEITATINPVWGDILESYEQSGLERPEKLPLTLSPDKSLHSFSQLLAAALLFLGVLSMKGRTIARRLFWTVAIISVIEGWMGFFNYALGGAARAAGGIFNPNHHAAFVLAGMPLYFVGLYHLRNTEKLRRFSVSEGVSPLLLPLAFGLIGLIGWLTSFSRGSLILGTPILLAWMGWEWLIARRSPVREGPGIGKIVPILIAGFIALIAMGSIVQGYLSRVGGGLEYGMEGRIELWKATLRGLMESPISGLGLGAVQYILNLYADIPTEAIPIWAHNDYVQIVAEIGIPASLLLIALSGVFLWKYARQWPERMQHPTATTSAYLRACLTGFAILMVHDFVDFHLRIPLVGFQVLILLALILNLRPGENHTPDPERES